MTWFKVDDRLHSHPKALATSLAALGLWTVAGSWSSDHRTGGVVPDHVILLLGRGTNELADELVAAGLWKRVRSGYRFHDWDTFNPTKQEAIAQADKLSSGGTLGNHRRWHTGKGVTKPDCPFCQHERASPPTRPPDRGGDRRGESPPNPPDPSRPVTGLRGVVTNEPPPNGTPPQRCTKHLNHDGPIPPCGDCADARRTHDAWRQQTTNGARPSPLDDQQIAARAREQRAQRVATGTACPHCGDAGMRFNADGLAVPCTHQP